RGKQIEHDRGEDHRTTLIRLAALGTLSRIAGEGLSLESAPLPYHGRGGDPLREQWEGEGCPAKLTGTAPRSRGSGRSLPPTGRRSPAAYPCRRRAPLASRRRIRSSAPRRSHRPGRLPGNN